MTISEDTARQDISDDLDHVARLMRIGRQAAQFYVTDDSISAMADCIAAAVAERQGAPAEVAVAGQRAAGLPDAGVDVVDLDTERRRRRDGINSTSEPVDLSGFTGWVPFAALPTADVPAAPGVYVVVRPTDEPPNFLDTSPAGHFQGKDPTVPVAELQRLWVPGTRIVYIGKANAGASGRRGLRKRLDEFRRHGAGEPVGHTGGRRIWQLADHPALLVGWRITDEGTAATTETQMIAQFRAHHGRLPFANMRA